MLIILNGKTLCAPPFFFSTFPHLEFDQNKNRCQWTKWLKLICQLNLKRRKVRKILVVHLTLLLRWTLAVGYMSILQFSFWPIKPIFCISYMGLAAFYWANFIHLTNPSMHYSKPINYKPTPLLFVPFPFQISVIMFYPLINQILWTTLFVKIFFSL